jgi:hypothetical protein
LLYVTKHYSCLHVFSGELNIDLYVYSDYRPINVNDLKIYLANKDKIIKALKLFQDNCCTECGTPLNSEKLFAGSCCDVCEAKYALSKPMSRKRKKRLEEIIKNV